MINEIFFGNINVGYFLVQEVPSISNVVLRDGLEIFLVRRLGYDAVWS